MAAGDIVWFDQALEDLGNAIHDFGSDTLKLGLVTSVVTPAATTSAPHWGGTGTTNMATNQVGTGGTSYTGPQTLGSVSWGLSGGVAILDAADVSLAQDASGFTNARWGIIYNDTDTNKRCIAYLDLGATKDLTAASLDITWNASGILDLDQA